MLPLLILLGVIGLAGAYWFLNNDAGVTQFWELAGLGVFIMFLMIGVSILVNTSRARGGRR